MRITTFEDIIAWQKAQDLAIDVYGKFGQSKDLGFRDQICRAAVSISNNIAEGFERQSDKQLSSFLFIALGSSAEVRSMLHLAARLRTIDEEEKSRLLKQSSEVSRLLFGFIKSLGNNPH